VHCSDPAERRRALDRLHQLAAGRPGVAIEHHGVDALDLERGREREHDQLHQRRHDQDHAAARIAQDDAQLLGDQGDDAVPHVR
jgi:hypothetical protein